MLQALAKHEAELNVTVYKQIWNEPDLTSYFNYTAGGTTFFHGTNADYNQMYEEGATAMAVCRYHTPMPPLCRSKPQEYQRKAHLMPAVHIVFPYSLVCNIFVTNTVHLGGKVSMLLWFLYLQGAKHYGGIP